MTEKPTALYYDILQYQPENLLALDNHFHLIRLPDPAHDDDDSLTVADVCFAPLGYHFDAAKMVKMPRLKVIASNTTGHPHIDVGHAERKAIAVVTLKDDKDFLDGITPTAEFTWGLIIALTRNIVPARQSFLEGRWNRRPFGAGSMLSRMSLGIVGLGRLGRKVARCGEAFGMDVAYFDPFVDADGAYQRFENLHDLLRRSDVVSLHIPYEPDLEGMFGQDCLEAMPKGSYFVNTARGELMDFCALLNALDSGHLAGAALDVFEGEFIPGFEERLPEHPLWRYAQEHDNLIVTPHIGGSTLDAWSLTEARTIERVLEVLERTG